MTRRRRWLDRIDRGPRRPPPDPYDDPEELDDQAGDGDDAQVPLVPFVPVRCPRCHAPQPTTYGVHELKAGKTRYHLCQREACGCKFQSREINPADLNA